MRIGLVCHAVNPAAGRRSDRGRRGPAGDPPGEQAAAEERALQRPVAVHAAAAEAGDLAGRVQAGDRAAVRAAAPAPTRSVSSPPRVLRVMTCSRTAISGPASGSSISCGVRRCASACRRSTAGPPRIATTCGSLPSPVRTCPSRSRDQRRRPRRRRPGRSPTSSFILATSSADGRRGQEVDALVQERLHRSG